MSDASCITPRSDTSTSSVRATRSTTTDPLPTNDDPTLYSSTSSQENYDLGASIIEFGSSAGGGRGAPPGKVLLDRCSSPSSPTRTVKSVAAYNCRDWYREVTPGVQNPATDIYLGTTCNYMWIPDGYRQSGGFAGVNDDTVAWCYAYNIDDTRKGCDVAWNPRTCTGAKAINQPASDTTNGAHSNRISGEFEIAAFVGGAEQILGWEYQTYGGQEYFQFAQNFSVSAGVVSASLGPGLIVPFRGNVFSAIQGAAKLLGVAASALPTPYNLVNGRTKIVKGPC